MAYCSLITGRMIFDQIAFIIDYRDYGVFPFFC